MAVFVDPTVDCVFKAILGSDHHKGLLIHFLNAVLDYRGDDCVAEVELKNPFNPKETVDGKLSVVDIKAVDQAGRSFQLEIQIANHAGLPERMLYTWSSIYSAIIDEGDDYVRLRPVIAIWLLAENLYADVERVHIPFGIYSPEIARYLSDHCRLHLLQLKKQSLNAKIEKEKDRWISLFRLGRNLDLDNPPEWMSTEEMREVMSVIRTFAEKGENRDLYLSRLDAQRVTLTWQNQIAEAQEKLDRAVAEKESERAEKERALAEKERLRQRLLQAGIDPDAPDT